MSNPRVPDAAVEAASLHRELPGGTCFCGWADPETPHIAHQLDAAYGFIASEVLWDAATDFLKTDHIETVLGGADYPYVWLTNRSSLLNLEAHKGMPDD